MKITNSSTAWTLCTAFAFVFLTCSSSATAQSNQPPADKEYEVGAILWQQSDVRRLGEFNLRIQFQTD